MILKKNRPPDFLKVKIFLRLTVQDTLNPSDYDGRNLFYQISSDLCLWPIYNGKFQNKFLANENF